jgi:drug/metabolite transporter (DMT)-like permease
MNTKELTNNIYQLRGYIYILFGLFLQTLIYFIWKFMAEKDVSPFAIGAYRGLFICLFSLIAILRSLQSTSHKFRISKLSTLLFRGMISGVGVTGIIFCVGLVRLSTMELLLRTGNIMCVFLGYFFMHESISKYDIYGIFSTFAGVILIIRPNFIFEHNIDEVEDSTVGILITLCLAFLIALGQISSKALMEYFNEFYLIFSMGLCNILISVVGSNIMNVSTYLSWDLVGISLFSALLDFFGFYFVFKSLQIEPIVKLSPYYNSKVVYAVVLSYFLYSDICFWDILGTLIIVSTYIYLSFKNLKIEEDNKKLAEVFKNLKEEA